MDKIMISVLGHYEDGEWWAIALEMDLVADGETFEDASEKLGALIENQLSFASYKNQADMAFKAAPVEYFSLFAQIKQERMKNFITSAADIASDYVIGGIPMPHPHIIAEMEKDFSPVNA